jgi:hypothetical protein
VHEVYYVCVVHALVLVVLLNKQPIDQAKAAGTRLWCYFFCWCACCHLLGFCRFGFGGFGAKMDKFKSPTLYVVVAMKLLQIFALHLSSVLIAPFGTFYCRESRAVGIHNIGISVEIVDAICSGTCCILARGGASVFWGVQKCELGSTTKKSHKTRLWYSNRRLGSGVTYIAGRCLCGSCDAF